MTLTESSVASKKVQKRKALPLETPPVEVEESKGPQVLDMAAIIKLQQDSKVPINLNIQMNVDEKSLATEMFKKMNLPVP